MAECNRNFKTARELYDTIDFKTDALFNEPAPHPALAFVIGTVSM